MQDEPELSPEEAKLLRDSRSRGYTPRSEAAEPEEPPAGAAGTSHTTDEP